jgi:hypothetical protein
VCVLEPDTTIALIVNAQDGAVQTFVNRGIGSDEALVGWLSTVFTRADWQPEALVLVGSGGEFDSATAQLEDALSVPVYAPAEAELALARGAALASAQTTEFTVTDVSAPIRGTARRRRLSRLGPIAMLATGAVTFVVSGSLALGLHLTSANDTAPAPARPTVSTSPTPAAEPAVAVPPVETPPAPAADVAPPEVVEETPPAEVIEEGPPAEAPVEDTFVPDVEPAAPPPPEIATAPPPPEAPASEPPLLTRILEQLQGLHPDPPPPPEAPAPPP